MFTNPWVSLGLALLLYLQVGSIAQGSFRRPCGQYNPVESPKTLSDVSELQLAATAFIDSSVRLEQYPMSSDVSETHVEVE